MLDEKWVGWQAIDREMRTLARRRAALDAEEAALIVKAKRAEVHLHLGYGSFGEYLQRACGYAPGTARERVRVAEALEELPAMREALAAGEVSFSAVRELSRKATPVNEQEWLDAVAGCTVREIEDALQGHEVGDHPDDRPDPALETRRVCLALTPEAYALFREARQTLELETGSSMTDAELIAMVCRRALAPTPESNQPPFQVSVTRCRDCARGWQETGPQSVELPPATLDRICCDATELGHVDGATPDRTTRTIPAPIRRAVLARDHHRCSIPGCNSSRYIEVHHLLPWSQGGTHEMHNLAVLCDRHHQLLHDNQILIQGTPGSFVVFHADGRPYGTTPSHAANAPLATSHVERGATSHVERAAAPHVERAGRETSHVERAGRETSHVDRGATSHVERAGRETSHVERAGRETSHVERSATLHMEREVERALVTMGFTQRQAATAVAAAASHVERAAPLETMLRAALQACPRPRAPS